MIFNIKRSTARRESAWLGLIGCFHEMKTAKLHGPRLQALHLSDSKSYTKGNTGASTAMSADLAVYTYN